MALTNHNILLADSVASRLNEWTKRKSIATVSSSFRSLDSDTKTQNYPFARKPIIKWWERGEKKKRIIPTTIWWKWYERITIITAVTQSFAMFSAVPWAPLNLEKLRRKMPQQTTHVHASMHDIEKGNEWKLSSLILDEVSIERNVSAPSVYVVSMRRSVND